MADSSTTGTTLAPQTDPLAKGSSTSEFRVTMIAAILSTIATIVGIAMNFLDVIQQAGVTGKWVAIATTVAGILGTVLSALGYTVTRAAVKQAALQASAAMSTVSPAAAAANLGRAP